MTAPEWAGIALNVLTAWVLPWLIWQITPDPKKVIDPSNRKLMRTFNFAVAIVSSVAVGALTAWVGGDFGGDVWANISVGITATQAAYQLYWKERLAANEPTS